MKSRYILVALPAFVLQARADRVSQSEVEGAASVWAGAGSALGVSLGSNVESVREHVVANGCSFYVVKLSGGSVIMTSDTSLDPVVAFSSSGNLDLSGDSPLFKLLCKDIAARVAIAGGAAGAPQALRAAAAPASSASSKAPGSSASSLWSFLLRRASAGSAPSRRLSASEKPLPSISDVRVAPMVKSKWSQADGGGGHCYNYCTPNHLLCGCTATAMSQIMRYFEFPKTPVAACTYECVVDKETVSLTMQGGTYDWGKMTLVPGSGGVPEANRREIGKLTSDTGIALMSSYSAAVTTADPEDIAVAFRDAFGYPDAINYFNTSGWNTGEGGLHTRLLRDRIIYANLDAGQPVQFSIYGYPAGHVGEKAYFAGHSVVADGYGFMTVGGVETEYVHVNMGWAGTDDMWYNIPEIDAASSGAHTGDSGYDFLYLGGAVFNISTNGTGLAILSGRVTDGDGAAVAGARVGTFDEGGVRVGDAETSESGVYFFKLPGGSRYSVAAATPDGRRAAELDAGVLRATTGMDGKYVVTDSSKVGNSWGNDMTLEDAVGYYVDAAGRTNAAARIDSLVERYAAQLAAGELGESPRMVLRRGGALTRPVPVVNGLAISGNGVSIDLADAPATVFPVTGGRLTVTGVTFTNFVGNAVFLVDNGATIRLSGVRLADIEGTNYHSGAVAVLNGAATIGGGSVLDNCRASMGGGVHVASGRKLVLAYGCTITNCHAQTCGGGVYADEKSAVYLSGAIRIAGNGSQDSQNPVVDNMYLRNPTSSKGAKVGLTDTTVTGSVGIRWSDSNEAGGNSSGMRVASADSATIAHGSAGAFFSDVDASLAAAAVDSPAGLVWTDAPPGPPPPPTPPGGGAEPLPIAFSAIAGNADGTEWTLAVTTVVENCWYSLYETNSVADGFSVYGQEPVVRRQAGSGDVPAMTFTRPANGSQLFWKVVAEPENSE